MQIDGKLLEDTLQNKRELRRIAFREHAFVNFVTRRQKQAYFVCQPVFDKQWQLYFFVARVRVVVKAYIVVVLSLRACTDTACGRIHYIAAANGYLLVVDRVVKSSLKNDRKLVEIGSLCRNYCRMRVIVIVSEEKQLHYSIGFSLFYIEKYHIVH